MYYFRPGHPKASPGGFVSADDLAEIPMDPPEAKNAPILSGRFYENTVATDGTDIGSRAKHHDYMKANNLTMSSDYTRTWEKCAEQREAVKQGHTPSKTRRDVLERTFHKLRGY